MAVDIEMLLITGVKRFFFTILILLGTFAVSSFVNFLLRRGFSRGSRHLKVDATRYNFFRHVVRGVIYAIGISLAIFTIPSLRSIAVSLVAGAGILAVVVGFASQQAFSNIVAGIFLVIFKPFKVGERIKINSEVFGVVEDINLRHTIIRNFENKRLIIPNSIISNETIENWDSEDKKICKFIEFGISYDSDIDKAMKIIQTEAMKHGNLLDNRSAEDKAANAPVVPVRVMGLGIFQLIYVLGCGRMILEKPFLWVAILIKV